MKLDKVNLALIGAYIACDLAEDAIKKRRAAREAQIHAHFDALESELKKRRDLLEEELRLLEAGELDLSWMND